MACIIFYFISEKTLYELYIIKIKFAYANHILYYY